MVSLAPISLWEIVLALIAALLILGALVRRVRYGALRRRRRRLLAALGQRDGAVVLTLVHRSSAWNFLGRAMNSSIDMDDAESLVSAIRASGDRPIDLVMHTPGGAYHASLQIARALRHHKGKTRVYVPHMAMSGGTLIALAADEIAMDPDAMMGPVDPQIGDLLRGVQSAASWVKVAREKGKEADDSTLALADVSQKLLDGTRRTVIELIEGKVADSNALVARLVEGGEAHGYPMTPQELAALGLPVKVGLPPEVHEILATYRASPRGSVESVR
ncbi:MAG: SDH family Clp fold serine proteinase [Thermoplasmatota archaeon]